MLTLVLLLATAAAASAIPAGPPPRIIPDRIEMDGFFAGARVRIEGEAEPGATPIILVRGPEETELLSRKRRLGFIWISAGRLEFSGVPNVWLVFSPEPVSSLLSRDEIEAALLDRGALRSHLKVKPQPADVEVVDSHYLEWKFSRRLYAVSPRVAGLVPSAGRYTLEFDWPKSAPPDPYHVTVYQCRDRRIVSRSSRDLEVVRAGIPARIADLSTSRASLYGILCILAAVAAGFGMDAIVSLLGGKRTGH